MRPQASTLGELLAAIWTVREFRFSVFVFDSSHKKKRLIGRSLGGAKT